MKFLTPFASVVAAMYVATAVTAGINSQIESLLNLLQF
jgi:hypothetical protein